MSVLIPWVSTGLLSAVDSWDGNISMGNLGNTHRHSFTVLYCSHQAVYLGYLVPVGTPLRWEMPGIGMAYWKVMIGGFDVHTSEYDGNNPDVGVSGWCG